MKTSYYLFTAAGLTAAAVAVYTLVPGLTGAREAPTPTATVSLPKEQPAPPPFGQANVDLPPIVTPPDGNLVIPVSASGLPAPSFEEPAFALPPVPAVPAVPTTKKPELPAIPAVELPPVKPPIPAIPPVESLPPITAPTKPVTPVIPPPDDLKLPALPAVPPVTPTVEKVPVAPAAPPVLPVAPAAPMTTVPVVPLVPASPSVPSVPVVPPTAVTPPVPVKPVTPPALPTPPEPTKVQPLPAPIDLVPAPGLLQPPPVAPAPTEVLPKPAPLPVPATPSSPPAGLPLLPPPPTSDSPAATNKPTGKYLIVKADKSGSRLVEGSVIVTGEKAVIRQGSFDRSVPKTDIVFVAETKDEVYKHLIGKVPAKDVPARLSVAKWLMYAGMREQALAEAREILKVQPANVSASEMARSLEESIKQFPGDGTTPISTKPAGKPTGGTLVTEPEPDVTPEGATSFVSRAQPVLANQCMECHARADYPGAFKLIRVNGFEIGPQSTNANLRATAAQLRREDPLSSSLLTKALSQHGGMKQPAFVSRQSAGYRVLEAWVLQAVTPVVQPMPVPAQPVLPPVAVTPPMPIPPAPVLPPVEPTVPVIPPATPGAAVRPMPLIPPAPPIDVPPLTLPAVPDLKVPPVLPTPPSIPPADAKPIVPTVPAIPVIPPAAALPKPPGGVVPASGTGSFGTEAPKPPVPTGPTGGDEFDPAMFNKAGMGK